MQPEVICRDINVVSVVYDLEGTIYDIEYHKLESSLPAEMIFNFSAKESKKKEIKSNSAYIRKLSEIDMKKFNLINDPIQLIKEYTLTNSLTPKTLALNLTEAQELIDKARIPVAGLFPIHPLGYAIPPSLLDEFTKKNDLILISDVCESLGSWSEGMHAGTSGIAGSFSFYFSHHITTMEGGGVATNDSEIADDLRSMRSHGWSRDRSDVREWTAQISNNDAKFLFVSTGYNVRAMEIQAVIGSSQIKEISNYISHIDGGKGCVRDVIEQVMKVQGKWMSHFDAKYD